MAETGLGRVGSPLSFGETSEKVTYDYYFKKLKSLPSYQSVQVTYNKIDEKKNRAGAKGRRAIIRNMVKDRFYLLTRILGCHWLDDEFHYVMCRIVEEDPHDYLDLWFREGGKTQIITFGGIIQYMLLFPEETVGIFAYSRPIAKAIMKMVLNALEKSEELIFAFPEVLCEDKKDYASWSIAEGQACTKGWTGGNTFTLEAHSLIDKQPTSKHFTLRVYDDIVTQDTVQTSGAIKKAISGWQLSHSLGKRGGHLWHIGTIYALNGPYHHIKKLGKYKIREFPITYSGTKEGDGPFFNRFEIENKYIEQGPRIFACQNLMDPQAGGSQLFRKSDLRYWTVENFYSLPKAIIVDPSKGKNKKRSDYTAAIVVGRGADFNWYIIDMVRDKLSLRQRTDLIFDWHRRYQPQAVYYEEYGPVADIEHFEYVMGQMNYHFRITPLGGKGEKADRIERLDPLFATHSIFLPTKIEKVGWDGLAYNPVNQFIDDEYDKWPTPEHDDMLDALSRIKDIYLQPEGSWEDDDEFEDEWDPLRGGTVTRGWAG